jgi:hypothetical protein
MGARSTVGPFLIAACLVTPTILAGEDRPASAESRSDAVEAAFQVEERRHLALAIMRKMSEAVRASSRTALFFSIWSNASSTTGRTLHFVPPRIVCLRRVQGEEHRIQPTCASARDRSIWPSLHRWPMSTPCRSWRVITRTSVRPTVAGSSSTPAPNAIVRNRHFIPTRLVHREQIYLNAAIPPIRESVLQRIGKQFVEYEA